MTKNKPLVEQTLVLVKPDGVYRGLIGEVLQRFERAGLKIIGMKMIWIDKNFSKKHYSEHLDKSFYPGLEQYITAGPVVAMVIEGVSAVKVVRKIAGPTEPEKAVPGTIRGDYSHVNVQYADAKKKSVCNIIHSSGTKKEAKDEIMLWFDPPELHSYKRSGEKWMQ
ncbi:nucleoside-diphosphate kinase [archaeon]|nr:nucleoside-diphosphate kinase [archaeon]